MKESRRIYELDALRGIAALAVVLFHYTTRFAEKFGYDYTLKPVAFSLGFYGVELFFIISGFVIYMTVDKVKGVGDFAKRRFVRLFPTFWFCMVVTYLLVTQFGPDLLQVSPISFLLNFTIVPKLLGGKMVDKVYWSLAVELTFYATMVLLIWGKLEKHINIISLIVLVGIYGIVFSMRGGKLPYYGSLFITGIHFYKIWNHQAKAINHIIIGICLALTLFSRDGMMVLITAICYLLFYMLVYRRAQFLKIRPLMFLGEISYAWYLLHQNIGYIIEISLIQQGYHNYFMLILLPLLTTILMAFLVTRFFEKPVVRIFNRKPPLRPQPVPG